MVRLGIILAVVTRIVVRERRDERIISLADGLKIDLLVLPTPEASGIMRILTGSVIDKVIRAVSCPVLVVPSCDSD